MAGMTKERSGREVVRGSAPSVSIGSMARVSVTIRGGVAGVRMGHSVVSVFETRYCMYMLICFL